MLMQILGPHFVAGVVLKNNTVVRAAPILKYMIGWSQQRVMQYALHKHWTVKTIP